ncbi:MAG: hypothetical protein KJ990_04005 [Proteobacteria bacterium]|nr:hypothetical protein [Pseudomonadota bacterium]MBU1650321.1 hypothetical protein [Pseudomonadota bacterium]MBU1986477.1 hypothetical protein [Pseudomonadota bacterium]
MEDYCTLYALRVTPTCVREERFFFCISGGEKKVNKAATKRTEKYE